MISNYLVPNEVYAYIINCIKPAEFGHNALVCKAFNKIAVTYWSNEAKKLHLKVDTNSFKAVKHKIENINVIIRELFPNAEVARHNNPFCLFDNYKSYLFDVYQIPIELDLGFGPSSCHIEVFRTESVRQCFKAAVKERNADKVDAILSLGYISETQKLKQSKFKLNNESTISFCVKMAIENADIPVLKKIWPYVKDAYQNEINCDAEWLEKFRLKVSGEESSKGYSKFELLENVELYERKVAETQKIIDSAEKLLNEELSITEK